MKRGTGPLVVAIDGPSGVGKSTIARDLAARLGLPYLDTGAMYRVVALEVLRHGADPRNESAVNAVAARSDLRLRRRRDGAFSVLLRGREVGKQIRAPEVGEATSQISVYPGVRARMVELQRAAARKYGAVVEGRDIGSRVFPDTPHKFFLDARPEVRFARRHEQLRGAGREVPMAAVVEEITRRDYRDTHRSDSPLVCDASYTRIDTSDLTPAQVVERMASAVETAHAAGAGPPGRGYG